MDERTGAAPPRNVINDRVRRVDGGGSLPTATFYGADRKADSSSSLVLAWTKRQFVCITPP